MLLKNMRTYDLRPRKTKRHEWVVRALWRFPAETRCAECATDLQIDCDEKSLMGPQEIGAFFAPYYWIEVKCPHDSSSHKGIPVLKSVFESSNGPA